MIIGWIKNKTQMIQRTKQWRKRNLHNTTVCSSNFPINQVEVGNMTYGMINALIFSDDVKLVVGSYCSIAPEVRFIVSADHALNKLSTFPFKVKVVGDKYESISKGNIIVQDDVWIGYGATILSGVTIGQGAVIAAGAVVASDVPPYAIVGGVPAKIIKYRFSKEKINFLLTLDYGKLQVEHILEYIDDIYLPIDTMRIEEIRGKYKWFPKKNNYSSDIV